MRGEADQSQARRVAQMRKECKCTFARGLELRNSVHPPLVPPPSTHPVDIPNSFASQTSSHRKITLTTKERIGSHTPFHLSEARHSCSPPSPSGIASLAPRASSADIEEVPTTSPAGSMLPDPGQTSQSTSSTPILPDPLLRVRLTRVTTSALPPDEGLDQLKSNFSGGKTFEHVPIIRVMGVTEGGQVRSMAGVVRAVNRTFLLTSASLCRRQQKACVNVHGAFPYFYIDYPKDQPIDPDSGALCGCLTWDNLECSHD